jgi:hypothetical protein
MKYSHRIYIQQAGLKSLGFDPGPLDGIEGALTRAAFRASLQDAVAGDASPLAQKLVRLAHGEVGVRESPKNSNRGKRVQEYQAADWLDGTGYPWCASFICWLCREAGVESRPRTAGAWDFERWARKSSTPANLLKPDRNQIKAGDIVVFTFSHIGLAVEDQEGDTVRTIEGNTDESGSREGGGVYAKVRSLRQIRSIIRIP